ncbi:hypothetical protein L6164_006292 [Bauhinia variegata]|uniref:Uncharacterized protein n=1 Tax=Bauhinia variegata TaxID=167791 RepID=A0ACB9PVF1_BAUVA|nr:hypothetical protein L6164_006292 [Bauhinia variegata]
MGTSLLLALSFLVLHCSAKSEQVVDTEGKKLRAGDSYLILPAQGGAALSLAHYAENASCPLYVTQPNLEDESKGQPVTFLPINPHRPFIDTYSDLNIKFTKKSSECAGDSMVWRVVKRITEARFIGTDGVERNPGRDALFNWFQIRKAADADNGYNLVFCPVSLCRCQISCSELGIFVGHEDKKSYLGFADPARFQQLSFVFERANSQAVLGT